MRVDRSYQQHLVVNEVALAPGREWAPQLRGWAFIYLAYGVGYWLHPRSNHQLPTGAVLVLSDQAQGCFRTSQLGQAVLQYFHIKPERLTGLVTLGDQRFLQNASRQDRFSFRVFAPSDPICERFKQLQDNRHGNNFPRRLKLLEMFIHTFGEEFANEKSEAAPGNDAKVRLTRLLEQMAASDLLEVNFVELAQRMRCTPRHLSRTFHQVVGMSFREKQAELRLIRAQELLATTETKVLEVALESGYQSVSLFNLMFKRRFGTSPGKWREQIKKYRPCRTVADRMQMLRA